MHDSQALNLRSQSAAALDLALGTEYLGPERSLNPRETTTKNISSPTTACASECKTARGTLPTLQSQVSNISQHVNPPSASGSGSLYVYLIMHGMHAIRGDIFCSRGGVGEQKKKKEIVGWDSGNEMRKRARCGAVCDCERYVYDYYCHYVVLRYGDSAGISPLSPTAPSLPPPAPPLAEYTSAGGGNGGGPFAAGFSLPTTRAMNVCRRRRSRESPLPKAPTTPHPPGRLFRLLVPTPPLPPPALPPPLQPPQTAHAPVHEVTSPWQLGCSLMLVPGLLHPERPNAYMPILSMSTTSTVTTSMYKNIRVLLSCSPTRVTRPNIKPQAPLRTEYNPYSKRNSIVTENHINNYQQDSIVTFVLRVAQVARASHWEMG